MPTKNDRESRMIHEVRRWRKEVFEQDSNKSLDTGLKEEQVLDKQLGLDSLQVMPATKPPLPKKHAS